MTIRQRIFISLIIFDLVILILLLFFSFSYANLDNRENNNQGIIEMPSNSEERVYFSVYHNEELDVMIKFKKMINISNISIRIRDNNTNDKNFINSYEVVLNDEYITLIDWIRFPIKNNNFIIINGRSDVIKNFQILDNYVYCYEFANVYTFKNNESTIFKTTTKKVVTTTQNNEDNNKLVNNYYYEWTSDEETDFSGRNCLFLYDKNGNRIDGSIELIYYDKYKKIQTISNDLNNCFLEDKKSVKINAIIVNGVKYEEID